MQKLHVTKETHGVERWWTAHLNEVEHVHAWEVALRGGHVFPNTSAYILHICSIKFKACETLLAFQMTTNSLRASNHQSFLEFSARRQAFVSESTLPMTTSPSKPIFCNWLLTLFGLLSSLRYWSSNASHICIPFCHIVFSFVIKL